ncbi:hypothetical protein ACSMXN_01705 [Jatrophihabitans sp. DSM 45814]
MIELANLEIPARFNGPPDSGNGGVTAGLIAARFGFASRPPAALPVTVTLRLPPPLDVPLRVEQSETALRAFRGTDLVADAMVAATGEPELIPVAAVDLATAVDAMSRYDGYRAHPFPTCFVCGTDRVPQDGLAIWAGAVVPGEPSLVAAPFTPDETELDAVALVWAALDCPGGWSIGLTGRRAVLGRMTAQVLRVPNDGEPCVVVAQCDGWQARKASTRVSLYGGDGELLGVAAQTWIELR